MVKAKTLLIGKAVILASLCSISTASANDYKGEDYPGSAYKVRKSTMAAQRTNPSIGRKYSTKVGVSNPYEARKMALINAEERYQMRLAKWEAKQHAKDQKARITRDRDERKRQAELKKEADKKSRQQTQLAKSPEKRSFIYNAFNGNKSAAPKPAVVNENNMRSSQSEADLASLPTPNIPEVNTAAPLTAAPKVEAQAPENPGFFTRLKWAIFGR